MNNNISWNEIIGHEENIAQLQRLLLEQRLPHALLFCGPRGIGKFLTARVLAAALLCGAGSAAPCGHCESCRAYLDGNHPDLYEIEPEGKTLKTIKIDQIRTLQAEIALAPYMSQRRVVILDEAEKINEVAANALLKTLEEPTGQIVFILIATGREALLDTIVSRVSLLSFQPLPVQQLAAALARRGVAANMALATLAGGSFGRALELDENGGLSLRDEVLAVMCQIREADMEYVWSVGAALGEMNREKLQEWFSYLQMIFRDMVVLYETTAQDMLYNSDVAAKLTQLLADWPLSRIFAALALLETMQQRLVSNANGRLLAEQFLLKLRDLK